MRSAQWLVPVVTEGRAGHELYEDQRLHAAAAGHGSTEAVAGHILDDVVQFQNGACADDIAIVVLNVP